MMSLSSIQGTVPNNTVLSEFHASKTAGTFAADLGRRIAQAPATLNTDKPEYSADPVQQSDATKQRQLDELQSGIARSISYVAQKYGEEAGTTAMAIMYKRLGDTEEGISEQALGQAFLDVTAFLDKNASIEAGDDFIRYLNNTVNEAMNEYFDNGLNEEFMAVSSSLNQVLAQDGEQLIDAGSELAGNQQNAILALLEEARAAAKAGSPYAPVQDTQGSLGVMTDVMV